MAFGLTAEDEAIIKEMIDGGLDLKIAHGFYIMAKSYCQKTMPDFWDVILRNASHTHGFEDGQTPEDWINKKIEAYSDFLGEQ